MKFACESCQTKYTIPDEKVRGKVLKIRCKKCGTVITVKEEAAAAPEPEAPPVEERTRVADIGLLEKLRQAENAQKAAPAMPARAPEAEAPPIEWYAMIGGEQAGPLSPDDMAAKIAANEVTERTHIWRDGMADWKRASEVPEVSSLFAPAPPPKPAPAKPAPKPSPAANAAGLSDDVPTVMRPKPDLDALFGEAAASEPTDAAGGLGGMSFDDAPPPARNGSAKPARTASSSSNQLADLMGDIGGDDDDDVEKTGAGPLIAPGKDPFSDVPDAPQLAQPQIGEQTRFFMKKAGVTNRNPWWKYAIFILCIPGFLGAALYGLGKSGYGGTVVVYDAQTGKQMEVQRFSFENIKTNGLAALLAGANKPHPAPHPSANPQVKKVVAEKKIVDPNAGPPKANLTVEEEKKLKENLAVLADPDAPSSSGPKERKDVKAVATDTGNDGLSQDVVAKIVGENTPSLNKCVEDKLKRDPSWKGGRVNVSVKIGPSGTVLGSSIDKRDVANSDVGDCLKDRIKRMRFPRFAGEEPQEVQFPLLLTNGG